jgi:hypothetical protein
MRWVFLLLLAAGAQAQWLDYKTPGIPRTPDGKPNLSAPTPRTADGKPDLSGLWQAETNSYRFNVAPDAASQSLFRPAAAALYQEHVADFHKTDPVTNCQPGGPSEVLNSMYRIIQSPGLTVLMYESGTGRFRQIYTDGRGLPADPNPSWMGYSAGRWEGDTLVVESAGFNDRTWLDRSGHPHSARLRVTERFRRVDFGHMEFQITYDDPETLTRPLTLSLKVNYQADTDLIENVCNETGVNWTHMIYSANAGVAVDPAVLAKYAGTYEYRDGSLNVRGFVGKTQTITLTNGRLYMNTLPLVPQTQTKFESTGAAAEFITDPSGRVTHMVLSQTEGDARYSKER